jgi:hypothetical protein
MHTCTRTHIHAYVHTFTHMHRLHPGVISTDLSRNNGFAGFAYTFCACCCGNVDQGSATTIYCVRVFVFRGYIVSSSFLFLACFICMYRMHDIHVHTHTHTHTHTVTHTHTHIFLSLSLPLSRTCSMNCRYSPPTSHQERTMLRPPRKRRTRSHKM